MPKHIRWWQGGEQQIQQTSWQLVIAGLFDSALQLVIRTKRAESRKVRSNAHVSIGKDNRWWFRVYAAVLMYSVAGVHIAKPKNVEAAHGVCLIRKQHEEILKLH